VFSAGVVLLEILLTSDMTLIQCRSVTKTRIKWQSVTFILSNVASRHSPQKFVRNTQGLSLSCKYNGRNIIQMHDKKIMHLQTGGVRWVRTHSQILKCKIKNTDTVHNAPCVEERSTFYKKIPPIFHFFTKTPPFHFLPTGLI